VRLVLLCILCVASFLLLLMFTVRASWERGVFDNRSLMEDVWFQVTLLDAYLGFLTVYVWIAWKERTALRRSLWFVLVMSFGNMAVSLYVLLQLLSLPRGSSPSEILTIRIKSASGAAADVRIR
jgi:hypothetical protein